MRASCIYIGVISYTALVSGLPRAREFARFTHETVPGYSLDVTDPTSLGIDTGVHQQAGYLGTPSGDQLFYWYFESRDNPSTDPVLIWLNGGPGCSSLEAVLFENGPASIDDQGQLSPNQWSWNSHANLLYIDNPAGVGYSTGTQVYDSNSAAVDFKNAVRLFWEHNKERLENNELHLSGESYAGRYIPVFAEAINSDPQGVNISSIMIGNGLVSPIAEYNSYQPMLCGQGGYAAVLNDRQCNELGQQASRCTNLLQPCLDGEELYCGLSMIQCNGLQSYFRGRNPYDIRDAQCTQTQTNLCYPGLDQVQAYFNKPEVKKALGVKSSLSYSICNSRISSGFYANYDPLQPTFRNVTNLLESGVPALVYNGDADIVLNWLGAREWTNNLEWSGKQGFQAAAKQPVAWTPSTSGSQQQPRGEVTNFGKLTFLRVGSAGHMVPHDQPESAYYLVYQWLRGDLGLATKVPPAKAPLATKR